MLPKIIRPLLRDLRPCTSSLSSDLSLSKIRHAIYTGDSMSTFAKVRQLFKVVKEGFTALIELLDI